MKKHHLFFQNDHKVETYFYCVGFCLGQITFSSGCRMNFECKQSVWPVGYGSDPAAHALVISV